MNFSISSPDFTEGQSIPTIHTCDGSDRSPALAWSNLPAGTKSLALIVDDPDAPDPAAPQRVYVHWVLYNLPVAVSGLAQGIEAADLPAGTCEGLNDWGKTGYGGPCPPIGSHRYFHKLYALDTVLPDLGLEAGKKELEQAMQGHILGQAQLMGRYQRDQ